MVRFSSPSEIVIEQRREFLEFNLDGRMSPKDAGREWSSMDFDGTTVLCRVCGDKASGFHYGVHSCEGCKGFFRRSIQQKIQYRPCTKNQQCSILRVNRNRCQYCRLKKCIAVGMSRDAVRFGRVPKREKAKILAAMQSVNARSQEKALAVELEDESKLVVTIVTAHIETCDYTKDKMGPLIQAALEHPVYTQCTPQLACPLNPNPHPLQNGNQLVLEDFSQRFSPAIRGVVEFAKRIPGFGLLSQDDQVTLLKAGVFEVLLVRLACMFDSRANTMICLNGQVLKRESLLHTSNARFLMDSMFDFADRMNTLHLADGEVGLFCAVVVIAADRPGLRNVELVEKMQDKLLQALRALVSQGHPESPSFFQELMKKIPDLRTLNTLHSEKLLAFKMAPQVEAPHQTEVAASTNMHAIYQTHVGHWGTYGMQQQSSNGAPSEDSKGSWEEQEPLVASHLMRGSNGVEGMAWSPSGNDGKDQDMYCSPRSSDTGSFVIDDGSSVKSPLSSVSSVKGADSESLCSGEMVHLPESHKRRNDVHHEGGSSGDESSAVDGPNIKCPYKLRKLESPTDSGIESGKELGSSGSSGSRSTSICSSPRSSMEDKVKDISDCEASEKIETIEDMPVLKRALQAPPLINTNLLMDEAYKPHKKFRALRKDSDSTPTSPDTVVPTSVSPHCPHSLNVSLASSHSMLVKTLEQGPRMSEQQLKRTDIIRNIIMRTEGSQNGRSIVELNSLTGPPPTSQHQYGMSTNGMVYALPQVSQRSTSPYGAAPATNNKGGVPVCPPGYYIPQPNGSIGNAYPTNPASSSWSTFVSAAQPTTVVAAGIPASCTPVQARPSYVPVSSGMQQMTATVSILPASPPLHPQYQTQQQQLQQAPSPGLAASPLPRMYYNPNPRGSASASPTLAATPQSPISVVVSQAPKRASPKPTSPMAGQILEHLGCRIVGDSQPLNLSKKLSSSPSPPPTHHLASVQAMERTVSAATLAHLQRVKLEAS